MRVEFHPAAQQELAAAVNLGEEQQPGLGGELLDEARRVTQLLGDLPWIGRPLDSRHRRFPLTRFPFGFIYRVEGDMVLVLAVAHRRQLPGYWRSRD
jgi:plasmid stabilization system protein ParE